MIVSHRGFSAGINLPHGLTGETVHGLPPYAPTQAYRVADYGSAVPREWLSDDPLTADYFIVVKDGQGMWIDLTRNQHGDRHVAAVPSIQGVNALTALAVPKDPVLEQYRSACPVHLTAFTGNRHCRHCGFDWPAQNYLSTATGMTMWIDGFRTRGSNGQPGAETRQFLFTSDVSRGVAAQKIGAARTFDISLHFYTGPAIPRPRYRTRGGLESMGAGEVHSESYDLESTTRGMKSLSRRPEIAAGARIRQDIGVDPLSVHEYGQRAATIRFHYVYESDARDILGNGRTGDGALSGLKTGNPGSGHKTY